MHIKHYNVLQRKEKKHCKIILHLIFLKHQIRKRD